MAGKLKRRLRDRAGVGDPTPSHASVLRRFETDGPATTARLARLEGMRPQSMGAVVAVLEQAAMVCGTPDPADRRQILLSLTEAWQARIGEGRAARQDWLSRTIGARLARHEQAQLAAALPLLERLVAD